MGKEVSPAAGLSAAVGSMTLSAKKTDALATIPFPVWVLLQDFLWQQPLCAVFSISRAVAGRAHDDGWARLL